MSVERQDVNIHGSWLVMVILWIIIYALLGIEDAIRDLIGAVDRNTTTCASDP